MDVTSTGKGLSFCINHTTTSPATKTTRAHVCSATNPMAFPRKLKIAPTTLAVMVGSASTVFPTSLLSAFASLFNHFFKVPSSFNGGPPIPVSPPKSPMTESTIVDIPTKRAESVEIIVTICSRIKIRILPNKDVFLSRTFSGVCLILATCV